MDAHGECLVNVHFLGGRWRSPLFSFLHQTNGRTLRADARRFGCSWVTEGGLQQMAGMCRKYSAKIGTNLSRASILLRTQIEHSFLLGEDGLCRMIPRFNGCMAFDSWEQVLTGGPSLKLLLCGPTALCEARNCFSLRTLQYSREMYGFEFHEVRHGPPHDVRRTLCVLEPAFMFRPYQSMMVAIDPTQICMRHFGENAPSLLGDRLSIDVGLQFASDCHKLWLL